MNGGAGVVVAVPEALVGPEFGATMVTPREGRRPRSSGRSGRRCRVLSCASDLASTPSPLRHLVVTALVRATAALQVDPPGHGGAPARFGGGSELTLRRASSSSPRRSPCARSLGWRLLAATGMRRGEALAPRWRDVDLDAGRLAVRRSVGVVKAKGAGERLVEGPTKTGRSRVVDLDAGTVAALRAYRAARGRLALDLVRDSALVLSNLDGAHRHPERFSRRFAGQVVQAREALEEERLPAIRLHDLRHTHATLLLADGVPVKVVSERLGHASATITLTVYQHVHPGMGREAADRFGALLEG